jgi:hypothetical protein
VSGGWPVLAVALSLGLFWLCARVCVPVCVCICAQNAFPQHHHRSRSGVCLTNLFGQLIMFFEFLSFPELLFLYN